MGERMALDDFLEPEVAITAVVAAAVFSPKARKWVRKGLVYGTAGVLIAGDAVTSLARNVGQGVQQASSAATNATHNVANQAKATANATTANATTEKGTGNAGSAATKRSAPKASSEQPPSPAEGTGGATS
jgi:hypothetical protein